jgi:hypothetical protein
MRATILYGPRGNRVASLALALAIPFAGPLMLPDQDGRAGKSMGNTITITIGKERFTATLADNATAAAFAKLLPLSIQMAELNGNEKFAELSVSVPTRATRPPSIQAGDVMMYGSRTLVLFYKSFPTTYSYTKIGRVDDPTGLAAALGSGNVDVTFERETR